MAINNRVCSTCGQKYSFCPNCGADKYKPSWASEFCSEDCKDIYQIATDFNLGYTSKADSQAKLNKIKLKPIEQYTSMIQKDINNIKSKSHEVVVQKNKK